MKVLLFTHSQDIDGMGCAVLANVAFSDFTLVPTKTFDITKNVKEFIDNKKIYSYDKIYVTDLCIKEPVLAQIDNDTILKNKLIVLDHHKTEIEEGNNKYDFVNIVVEQNGKKESGTSLFYNYLINNNYITRTNILDEFVEWTRQYDVYDWVKEKNEKARFLHILYETLGMDEYLKIINGKIEKLQKLEFNDYEMSVINTYFTNLEKAANQAINEMKVVTLNIEDTEYRVGYVRCEYKYRNDINEYVKKDNKNNVCAVGMIMTDIDTVSYRTVQDIDVSKIGKYFGGKGHRGASSNAQSNELFIKTIKENNIEI